MEIIAGWEGDGRGEISEVLSVVIVIVNAGGDRSTVSYLPSITFDNTKEMHSIDGLCVNRLPFF